MVTYVDLPVDGSAMMLSWKKHWMCCVNPECATVSWVLEDHRIAEKNCILTTHAAKGTTCQVDEGRTVSEVAKELSCDGHTVNDAVLTCGEALLAADRRRLNLSCALGLDETSFFEPNDQASRTTPPPSVTSRTTRSSRSCPRTTTSTWPNG